GGDHRHRRDRDDSLGGAGLRSSEGPHGAVPRRRVHGRFPPEDQDRGGRARPVRRQGRGGRGGRRQDRQHRRRQDLRDAGRDGDPHSNRRARSIRAVIKEPIRVKRLTLALLPLFVLAAGASVVLAQTTPPPPPTAAAPGSTATPAAPASKIDRGDTAWMLTSTALVLLM